MALANYVEIKLLLLPVNTSRFDFTITVGSFVWASGLKTAVTNVPLNSGQFQVGTTIANSAQILKTHLETFNASPQVYFVAGPDYVRVYLTNPSLLDLDVLLIYAPGYEITKVAYELSPPVELPTIPATGFYFQIWIIDTYEVETDLTIELAQQSNPVLEYDGGDNLVENIVNSKLSFNMLVSDASDGKFIHLFQGDEQRYLVELWKITDESEDKYLVWNGFLLPDFYEEPYTNGSFFVNFTAVDMLGTLKQKFFPKWFYYSAFPIGELLNNILVQTGLKNDMLISPSLVPGSDGMGFKNIIINLEQYIDGDDLTSLFDILSDVLKTNLLTIFNYRGFWWLEGFSKKHQTENTYKQFDNTGTYTNDVALVKALKSVYFSEGSLNMFGISPLKALNVNADVERNASLFSENVVGFKDFASTVFNGKDGYLNQDGAFINALFEGWAGVFTTYNAYLDGDNAPKMKRSSDVVLTAQFTEAQAVNNYMVCKEKPIVFTGIDYDFDVTVKLNVTFFPNQFDEFEEYLRNGNFDVLACFSIRINGIEQHSNRFSFDIENIYEYERSFETVSFFNGEPNEVILILRFRKTLKFFNDGNFELRILTPIRNFVHPFVMAWGYTEVSELSLSVASDESVSITATRNIAHTTEMDYDLPMISNNDASITNRMFVSWPLDNLRERLIERIDESDFTFNQVFAYNTYDLVIKTFQSNLELVRRLFFLNFKRAIYVNKNFTSTNISLPSWYYRFFTTGGSISKIGYLKSTNNPSPKIPEDYFFYDELTTFDRFYYYAILYPELTNNLDLWKIDGSETTDLFIRNVAKIIMQMQARASFRMSGTAFDLVFPNEILQFNYMNENKTFTPSSLTINLNDNSTEITAVENVYTNLTDIDYGG